MAGKVVALDTGRQACADELEDAARRVRAGEIGAFLVTVEPGPNGKCSSFAHAENGFELMGAVQLELHGWNRRVFDRDED